MRRRAILSAMRRLTTALNPSSCIVMSGVIATIATIPNASVITASTPLTHAHTPVAKGRMKLDVSGPDATPPESNANAVYIPGTKNYSPSDSRYPGIR